MSHSVLTLMGAELDVCGESWTCLFDRKGKHGMKCVGRAYLNVRITAKAEAALPCCCIKPCAGEDNRQGCQSGITGGPGKGK